MALFSSCTCCIGRRQFLTGGLAAVMAAALTAQRALAPLTHILFGTDYPFVKVAEGVKHLRDDAMSDADRTAIDRGNAVALLPRLKA